MFNPTPPFVQPPYGTQQPSTSQIGSGRYIWTTAGPMRTPDDMSAEDAAEMVRRYDAYIADLRRAADQASDFDRMVKLRQLEDAEQGRANALEIANLQARTSRYGTDVASRDRLRQLKEDQRQFDLKHGLEMQRLGLDRARTATDFLSSPDRFAQSAAFLDLSGRVLAGQPGAGTYGTGVTPRPNTMSDFAVLESGGNPYANRGSAMPQAGQGGAGSDARVKALRAVIDASPPSSGPGHDGNDYAVLNAAKAIYGMNLTPQQQSTINSNPEYKAILGSEGRALGYNPEAWWARQQQSRPGQGSVRGA